MFVTQLKEYIYNNNKIETILSCLGCGNITYHPDRDYYSCSHVDGDNSSSINIRNNPHLNYRSWTRNVSYDDGQDLISLIEYTRKCDFISALKWMHDVLGLEYSLSDIKKKPPEIDLKAKVLSVFTNHLTCNQPVNVADIEVLDDSVLDEYAPIEYIDWLREGITPNTCQRFNIQYSYKRKRIIIPHKYWATGDIIGINARTTIEGYEELGINKYSFNKGFNKSINIYGLWENLSSIIRKKQVIIFESEKSVLKRHSQFDERCVALGGKSISEEQKRILIGLGVDIIIALDNDVSLNEIYCLCEKFYGIRNVYFIKDTEGILNHKDSPADTSEKNFRKLFKNKIKYTEELHDMYLKETSHE